MRLDGSPGLCWAANLHRLRSRGDSDQQEARQLHDLRKAGLLAPMARTQAYIDEGGVGFVKLVSAGFIASTSSHVGVPRHSKRASS